MPKFAMLKLENNFYQGTPPSGMVERKAMIDSTHALSISRQAQLCPSSYRITKLLDDALDLSVGQFWEHWQGKKLPPTCLRYREIPNLMT
jgi:hypothetical protein